MKLLIAVLAVLAYIGSSHGLVPSNNAVDLIKKEETSDGKPLINAKL